LISRKQSQIMQPIGVIAWIVTGALAGGLAGRVMKSRGGILTDIVVGIIGGFVGGFIFNALGIAGTTGFNLWSLLVAFIGAVALLGVIHLVNGRGRPRIFS
jgi:uncharacterized membrane protein YeaQ/YmgE (transglycosylase-associated protein family)